MEITNNIKYVGVHDKKIDLFEGQYSVPLGIYYNSYIIEDEKNAIFDTVDVNFTDQWLANVKEALGSKAPTYLIIQHMEPDHSASIVKFTEIYPHAKIVSSAKAFAMMKGFFGTDFSDRQIVVGEGDSLSLGEHNLKFFTAPMVHWPEVIVTYEEKSKVLFSADAFGKFGNRDLLDSWVDEARRYYIGIVGKYGVQTLALLNKLSNLNVSQICPLHGPVLSKDLGFYLDLYKKWASYTPEDDSILIAYTSIYGNTKKAVMYLAEKLREKGTKDVTVFDLARHDMSEAIANAFKSESLVLATTTYNADIFPPMHQFLKGLTERNFQGRKVAFIQNGSWAPTATKVMKAILEGSKNLDFIEPEIKIMSSMTEENKAELNALAEALLK